MAFRRNTTWTTVAIGAALTLGTLATAGAQAPPGGAPAGAQAPGGPGRGGSQEPPPPYRPAKDAKDLRSVLFNWTWHLGMLRGVDEHELIVSLEYQGKGTLQLDRQPCTASKYRFGMTALGHVAPGEGSSALAGNRPHG